MQTADEKIITHIAFVDDRQLDRITRESIADDFDVELGELFTCGADWYVVAAISEHPIGPGCVVRFVVLRAADPGGAVVVVPACESAGMT